MESVSDRGLHIGEASQVQLPCKESELIAVLSNNMILSIVILDRGLYRVSIKSALYNLKVLLQKQINIQICGRYYTVQCR